MNFDVMTGGLSLRSMQALARDAEQVGFEGTTERLRERLLDPRWADVTAQLAGS